MIDSLTLSDWLDMLLAYTIVGIHFLAAHIQSICCHLQLFIREQSKMHLFGSYSNRIHV